MRVRTVPVIRVEVEPGPFRKSKPLPAFDAGWQADAACRTADPALFIAYAGEAASKALAYCNVCTVVGECDALARLHSAHRIPVSGVWGGNVWTTSGSVSAPNPVQTKRVVRLGAGVKRCWACDEEKLLSGFHRDSSSEDGVTSQCRDCRNGANRRRTA